jgi:hypothetical protein
VKDFWCYGVSDISVLKRVKKLNLTYCWRIVDFSGLISLTELVHRHCTTNIQSGFQTFSQLNNLQLGLLPIASQMKFAEALRKSLLKSFYLSKWTTSLTIIPLFNFLKYLQSLELDSFEGDLAIPAISTLGYLTISQNAIPILRIQGSNQNYPIYYVKIMHCTVFTEITVKRPISFMKFCSQGVSEVLINGDEKIKDRFFKDVYLKPED